MPLSDENRQTLLISVHKSIEESVNADANHIFHGRLNHLIGYPSNGGFTAEELKALEELKEKQTLRSALRKVFASSAASAFFEFFSIVDGVADPDSGTGPWTGVKIEDLSLDGEEQEPLLHDEFYATYWDWKLKRKNTNWSLDLEASDD